MPDKKGASFVKGVLYVSDSVSVADLSPNVATNFKVWDFPEGVLHKTEVPDVHPVLSHPVKEIRIILLYALMLLAQLPVTVSSWPPSLSRFSAMLCPSEEIETASILRDIDNDPTRLPTVTTIPRVPKCSADNRQRTLVSDSHPVPSHPVCPLRPMAVKAASPRPAPCTVTDIDPDAALLARLVVLVSTASIDTAMLPVPSRSPAVMTMCREP
jgi:hypothetical protein